MPKRNKKSFSITYSKFSIIAICLVVLVAIILFFTSKDKPIVTPTKMQSTTNNVQQNSNTTGNQSVATPDKSSSSNQSTTTADLIAPYGSLVSNHKPGQNGSDYNEASQCSSTTGAQCVIKFTRNDVVKQLTVKTIGPDGSVYWDWNTKDIGLTSGTWTVTAEATLNGQIKSTTDQLSLEIL